MKQPNDAFDLDAVFDAARAAPPQMPIGLGARILADAEANLPPLPLLQRLMAAIGGTAGLGGLVTATAVGFWIGVAPPQMLGDPMAYVGASTVVADVDMEVDEALIDIGGFGFDSEEG